MRESCTYGVTRGKMKSGPENVARPFNAYFIFSTLLMAACPVDFPQSNLLCPLYGARGGKVNVVGPGNKQNDSGEDRKVVDQAHVSGERHWHRPIAEAKPVKMKVSKRNQVNFLFKVVLTLYPRQG